MLVIDASLTLAWVFVDEKTPAADEIVHRVRDEGAIVPSLWRLEVANVLLAAERRGRIEGADIERRLELLAALPIAVDDQTDHRSWGSTLHLARAERLTSYDAAYLELAIRQGIELASLDRDLRRAARKLDVPVVP